MKLNLLLSAIEKVPEIEVEERIHKDDGTKVYVFSALLPFPHPQDGEPRFYVIVVLPGQEEVDDDEIEAMLHHLWMAQAILPMPPDPNSN